MYFEVKMRTGSAEMAVRIDDVLPNCHETTHGDLTVAVYEIDDVATEILDPK